MKLPISRRLLACADLVPAGARVADVGCDHGYLGIHLLQTGRAAHVIATDLREKPLQKARANAAQFGTADRMDFFTANGLAAVDPQTVDTVVIAGMGGDNIASILDAAAWVHDPRYTLILQPQLIFRLRLDVGVIIQKPQGKIPGQILKHIGRARAAAAVQQKAGPPSTQRFKLPVQFFLIVFHAPSIAHLGLT